MFLAAGVGAFSGAIFHVVMHAFFKALLFLGAGSVIHAMSNEQRMTHFGGLRRELPITFWTFLVATLAIVGIWPFAGFFSKDAILWAVLHPEYPVPGHEYLWGLGVITAMLTAFYMFRLVGMTFFGRRREPGREIHCHREESVSMLLPLVILGVLSFFGGWIGVPQGFGGADHFHHFLAPIFLQHVAGHDAGGEMLAGLTTMLGAAVVALIALALYSQRTLRWGEKMAQQFSHTYKLLTAKYYVDEIYQLLIVRPLIWFSRVILWKGTDALLIDGMAVHGTARLVMLWGRLAAAFQRGAIPVYLTGFVVGAVVVIWWVVV